MILGKNPVIEIAWHPNRRNVIALCGQNFVSVWKVKGKVLICLKEIFTPKIFL
jgi:hypothetical protein